MEEDVVGTHEFSHDEEKVFEELRENMDNCSVAFAAVAVVSMAMLVGDAVSTGHTDPSELVKGVTVGDVASWVDSLLVAALLRFGSSSFQRVIDTKSKDKQLAYAFQGVNRVALMFQQFTIAAVCVSVLLTLEAAAKYPGIVTVASGMFLSVAVIRSASMWWVLNRHGHTIDDVETTLDQFRHTKAAASNPELPWWDRLAIKIAFNYLTQYSTYETRHKYQEEHQPHSQKGAEPKPAQYEFSAAEENLLNIAVIASNNAGISLALQALAVGLVVTSDAATGEWNEMVEDSITLFYKWTSATLVFSAANSFDMAIHTEGNDVDHLLDGLGHKGLTKLFHDLSILAWAVVMAQAITVLEPFKENSPLVTFITERLGHSAADVVIEAQALLLKLIP